MHYLMFEVTNRPNEPVILLISMCNYIFMAHLLVTVYNQLEPGQGKSVMSQNLVSWNFYHICTRFIKNTRNRAL